MEPLHTLSELDGDPRSDRQLVASPTPRWFRVDGDDDSDSAVNVPGVTSSPTLLYDVNNVSRVHRLL